MKPNNFMDQQPFNMEDLSIIKTSGERYNPYEFNSGTTLCVSFPKFTVIAADTRNSSDYTINSRTSSKIFKLRNGMSLTGTGFHGDLYEVYKILKHKQDLYLQKYETQMTVKATAHFLMNVLYGRRFFPFYTFLILTGIEDNETVMYSYDPVGCYKKDIARCYGTSQNIIQPILDSKIYQKNNVKRDKEFTEKEVVEIIVKAFEASVERDVKSGDWLEIIVQRVNGDVESNIIELRRD